MLHKGIKLAFAILATASAVLAFLVVCCFDEVAVAGPAYAVTFTRTQDGASGPRVAQMLDGFVRTHGVNVGRLYADPRNDGSRRIYLAVGDPQAESAGWLAHGYPNFSRDARIELRPYKDIVAIHPDGTYYVYGSHAAATALAEEFATLGYYGHAEPSPSPADVLTFYGQGTLKRAVVAVGLVGVLIVAFTVTVNAKSYGIQRLHGRSYAAILWRDLLALAGFGAIVTTTVAAAGTALLFLYNGLNQIWLYASVALPLAGSYALAALLAHAVALALVHYDYIVNAVKGEVTAAWATIGAYALRIVAVALILSTGAATLAAGLAMQEQARQSHTWAGMGAAYYLRISSAIDDEKQGKAIDDRIGQWLKDADIRDEVTLSWRQRPGSRLFEAIGREALVVNDRYLLDHEIYAAGGARVRPAGEAAILVLIPQRTAADSARITAAVVGWGADQAGRSGIAVVPAVRTEPIRDHQPLPAYARSFSPSGIIVKDPVVVVVTGASGVIANDEYTSAASRGEILVEDPDRTMAGLSAAGLDAYVIGLSPYAQEAADKYRELRRGFGVQLFGLAAAVVVLVVTAFALSTVHCRRNAQALFAKHLCGWGLLRTHRRILVFEGLLALVQVLWTWHGTTSTTPAGAPPMPDLAPVQVRGLWLAGAVALLSLALFVRVLIRANATFVRRHSASLA